MREEYEIKFWKDWLNAYPFKRIKLVEKLPIVEKCLKLENIKNKNKLKGGKRNI